MDSAVTSNEKISEALRLLEEAAKDKKDELRHLIANKYTNLKNAVVEAEHSVAGTLSTAQKRALDALAQAKCVSEEKIKKAAEVVDTSVHENPWPYVGGAAVVAFLLGFILGRKQ